MRFAAPPASRRARGRASWAPRPPRRPPSHLRWRCLSASRRRCSRWPAGLPSRARPAARTARRSLELGAHRGERAADQPRDVHLRQADALGDLRLRQSLLEAHAQDLALALRQVVERRTERRAVLAAVELSVLGADRVHRLAAVVVTAGTGVERQGGVGGPDLHRLEHLLVGRPERLGDLGDARRVAELGGQLVDRTRHLRVELLQRARHANRPALVAEVALDLPHHVRSRVGRYRHLSLEVETVDRLDQPDRPDLLDVLELLATAGVTTGERADERQVASDQLLARGRVAQLVVAPHQLAVLGLLRRESVPVSPSDCCSASARRCSRSGPMRVLTCPSSTSNEICTRPSPPVSASSRSIASWRSSIASKPNAACSAMPPTISRMTPW